MKTKIIILVGAVLVSGLTTDAFGQFGQPVKVGVVLGQTIKGPQDQKVGTVKDLAVDLENGRIVEVIVARGGFLGVDSKYMAVPPTCFTAENDGKIVRLNLTGEKLDAAPQVDLSTWTEAMAQPRIEQSYQYFGITPYFLVPEHPAHQPNQPLIHHLGKVERAAELIGTETLNRQDEKLGRVENLTVDFTDGRVIEVTIATGNYLGLHGELSAVPPQVLHFDRDRGVVTLDVTRDTLNSAPHFPARARPEVDREQATAVYQAYHVMPYFLPLDMGSSNSGNVKPGKQGTSQADLDITARINKEILNADGLSADAKAVKVTTFNGRVTLRGSVATLEEKRRIGDMAARVVAAANVDNLLEVKNTSARASN